METACYLSSWDLKALSISRCCAIDYVSLNAFLLSMNTQNEHASLEKLRVLAYLFNKHGNLHEICCGSCTNCVKVIKQMKNLHGDMERLHQRSALEHLKHSLAQPKVIIIVLITINTFCKL